MHVSANGRRYRPITGLASRSPLPGPFSWPWVSWSLFGAGQRPVEDRLTRRLGSFARCLGITECGAVLNGRGPAQDCFRTSQQGLPVFRFRWQ